MDKQKERSQYSHNKKYDPHSQLLAVGARSFAAYIQF
jgi:hypothetical protein